MWFQMQRKKITLLQKIIPGVIALAILLIYYVSKGEVSNFYSWLFETTVFFTAYFFFLNEIIISIMEHEYVHLTIPVVIGILAFAFYMLVFQKTPEEMFVSFLNSTVLFSVFWTIWSFVKDGLQ